MRSAWTSDGIVGWILEACFKTSFACCCLLPQVVSCDHSGIMCVWDYHTGRRREHNAALHGDRPLTAAAFDARQVRTPPAVPALSSRQRPWSARLQWRVPGCCLMASTFLAEAAADCVKRRQRQDVELQQRGAAPPVQVHWAGQRAHLPALCPRRPEGVQQGQLLWPPPRLSQQTQGCLSGLFGELWHVMSARITEVGSHTPLQVVAAGWAPYRVYVWEDQAAAKVLQSRSLVGHRSAPIPAATPKLI